MSPLISNNTDIWRLQLDRSGILAPGRWFWLCSTAWMLALFAYAAGVFFASLELQAWTGWPLSYQSYVGLVIPVLGLVFYAIAVKIIEQRTPKELSLVHAPFYLFVGAIVGFSFMALSLILLWSMDLNFIELGHWRHWYLYFIFNAYISGVVEELGFRAILLRLFSRMFGPKSGLLISSVLFALAHANHAPPTAVALLIVNGGLLLGILYMVSGSLWLPIASHIMYDFTEWSLFGIGDKDGYLVVTPSPRYPTWLTGGSFGPDGSVFSALISILLIAGAIAIRRSQRDRGKGNPGGQTPS